MTRLTARSWLEHLLLAIVVAFLLIVPDHIFHLAYPAYPIGFSTQEFTIYCLLGFLIIGLGNGMALWLAIAFLALLQLGQLLHFAYFGTLVMPYEIGMLFSEWDEIWQSLAAFAWHAVYPILAVAVPATAIVWLRQRLHPRLPNIRWVALPILIGILSILPYRAYRGDATQAFYPSPIEHSIRNTLYAVSFRFGQTLPGAHRRAFSHPDFAPYRLVNLGEKNVPTVVIVMGESLTHAHMSLFGYSRKTTPWLDSMRGDANFVALPAIAGGVSTKVSLPTFFNVLREPGNILHLVRYETNLFKMAKSRGMGTHFFSAQNANLATYAGIEYADELVTYENLVGYDKEKDFALLRYLDRIDMAKPNLIVLHQRNSHGPYEESSLREYDAWPLPPNPDRKTYAVGTYDNSIRSTDAFLQRLWTQLTQHARGPVYLFMTSDHGEMMGENGRFGHNALTPEVARVPFLFAAINGDPAVVARIRALDHPTHYEIGREIARVIGYGIDNPNQRDARYYVNGVDLDNPGNCLALVKDASQTEGWRPVQDPLCAAGN
jgi:glucan phosphoethanolaminetransferase (alkaline phosphatase superfamily)